MCLPGEMSKDPIRVNSSAWTGELPTAAQMGKSKGNYSLGRAASVAVLILVLAAAPLKALYEGVTRGVIPVTPTFEVQVTDPFAFAAILCMWLVALALCVSSAFLLIKGLWRSIRPKR